MVYADRDFRVRPLPDLPTLADVIIEDDETALIEEIKGFPETVRDVLMAVKDQHASHLEHFLEFVFDAILTSRFKEGLVVFFKKRQSKPVKKLFGRDDSTFMEFLLKNKHAVADALTTGKGIQDDRMVMKVISHRNLHYGLLQVVKQAPLTDGDKHLVDVFGKCLNQHMKKSGNLEKRLGYDLDPPMISAELADISYGGVRLKYKYEHENSKEVFTGRFLNLTMHFPQYPHQKKASPPAVARGIVRHTKKQGQYSFAGLQFIELDEANEEIIRQFYMNTQKERAARMKGE